MNPQRALYWVCSGILATAPLAVDAQDFPSKTVRIIVPFPPGAGPDIVARTVVREVSKHWKQQVVVDNRPGAGGNIGTELAARATPDGHTLLLASNHVTINPSLFRTVPYDPVRDLIPLTLVTVTPNILVVHPSVPAMSVKDLITLARSQSGQINFSSGGNGSVGHLAGEMFNTAAGVRTVHVPYKGPVAAITALLNGEASIGFLLAAAALPHVKAGKIRALAVTGANRSTAIPSLPTVSEAGVAGYEIVAWQGLFAPTGTPEPVVRKIHADIVAAMDLPKVRTALLAQGLETVANRPEAFSDYIRRDLAKWAKVVRDAKVQVD